MDGLVTWQTHVTLTKNLPNLLLLFWREKCLHFMAIPHPKCMRFWGNMGVGDGRNKEGRGLGWCVKIDAVGVVYCCYSPLFSVVVSCSWCSWGLPSPQWCIARVAIFLVFLILDFYLVSDIMLVFTVKGHLVLVFFTVFVILVFVWFDIFFKVSVWFF